MASQSKLPDAMKFSARPFDILIYGATGFTGEAVARALALRRSGSMRRWAIGGRDRARLEAVRVRLPLTAARDAGAVAVVVVDALADDRAKLAAAFGTARVLVNCAGPFARFGRNVVQACIDAGTDYVDISGETQFILGVMLDEHERAVQRGVLIVSACGFDSVPADMGCKYVAAELDRVMPAHTTSFSTSSSITSSAEADANAGDEVTHIESFLHVSSGAVGHATTLECALMGIAAADKTNAIRRQLPQPPSSTVSRPDRKNDRIKLQRGIFRDARVAEHRPSARGGAPFCTLFPGTDSTIVQQTQRLEQNQCYRDNRSASFTSYGAYVVVGNWISVLRLFIYGVVCMALSTFAQGRALILKYPALFTGGLFSHDGPTDEQRASTSVTFDFFGKRFVGGKERARVVAQVRIPHDPGYTSTADMVLAAAETLLEERDATPRGGVVTPAVAFGKTNYLQNLSDTGSVKLVTLHAESIASDIEGRK